LAPTKAATNNYLAQSNKNPPGIFPLLVGLPGAGLFEVFDYWTDEPIDEE
jgi:hypothetical protein